jgi:endonuclease/exonuclease/phosphatase family metal-dependent hydrolase
MVKILDLNIWNYENFKERKPKIIRLIKEQDPDIVTLQEVSDDLKFNKEGENQAQQLNRKLNYPYFAFYLVSNMQKESPNTFGDRKYTSGNAILSKYPILKVVKKRLKKQKNDKHHRGILHAKIKVDKTYDIIVVHFSNNKIFSLPHLSETLDYVKKRKIAPIIIGDFNILEPLEVTRLAKTKYESSYIYKKYISYPSKKEVLDYILIPKELRFKSFKCLNDNVSDHRALVAEIV